MIKRFNDFANEDKLHYAADVKFDIKSVEYKTSSNGIVIVKFPDKEVTGEFRISPYGKITFEHWFPKSVFYQLIKMVTDKCEDVEICAKIKKYTKKVNESYYDIAMNDNEELILEYNLGDIFKDKDGHKYKIGGMKNDVYDLYLLKDGKMSGEKKSLTKEEIKDLEYKTIEPLDDAFNKIIKNNDTKNKNTMRENKIMRFKNFMNEAVQIENKWIGIDVNLEESLVEYGLLVRENPKGGDWYCIYRYGEGYDVGQISEDNLNKLIEGRDWVKEDNIQSFLSYVGQPKEEWLELSFVNKLQDLLNYFGPDNIMGASMKIMSEKEAKAFVGIEDVQESKKEGKKLPEKGTPEWHKIQIAKKTMKMSDIGANLMGGQTKEEAKKYLKEYGIKIDEAVQSDAPEFPTSENSIIRKIWIWQDGSQDLIVDNPDYKEKVEYVPAKWDVDDLANNILSNLDIDDYSGLDGMDIGIIPHDSTMVNMYRYTFKNGKMILRNRRPMTY